MKKKIFWGMPFRDEYLNVFEYVKKELGEKYEINHAGNLDQGETQILEDIIDGIAHSDVIIMDLTENNPNVFYELGIAHAMLKKTIMITQSIETIPFDLKPYRVFKYSVKFNEISELVDHITTRVEGAINNDMRFSTPVRDFASGYRNIDSVVNQIMIGDSLTPEQEKINLNEVGHDNSVDQKKITNSKDREIFDNINNMEIILEELENEINSLSDIFIRFTGDIELNQIELSQIDESGQSFAQKYNLSKKISGILNKYAEEINLKSNLIRGKWGIADDNLNEIVDFYEVNLLDESNLDLILQLSEISSTIDNDAHIYIELKKIASEMTGFQKDLTIASKNFSSSINQLIETFDFIKSSVDRLLIRRQGIVNKEINVEA